MSERNRQPSAIHLGVAVGYVHEILFSLNLGLALTVVFIYGWNGWLNWRVSESTTIQSWFPPTAAVSIWLLLMLFHNASFTHFLLRSAAGVLAVSATPLWFLTRYATIDWKHPLTVFQYAGSCELIVALCCVGLYLTRKWPLRSWGSSVLLSGHYAFWLWQYREYLRSYWVGLKAVLNYALQQQAWVTRSVEVLRTVLSWGWSDLVAVTALMPIIGLLSGFSWAIYIFLEGRPDSHTSREDCQISPAPTGSVPHL